VITYGTFDLFHVGHVRLLKRLRALGDRLIVGVSSDEFNLSKGKKSFYSFAERKEILEATDYVDSVFAEDNWEQKRSDIVRYKASIFGMGDDWSGEFDSLKDICDVVYLPRTEEVSTTDIKNALAKISEQDVEQLESSLHAALEVVSSLANSVKAHR
jgi:glycerol-3-phosphate cytidylyltransferase